MNEMFFSGHHDNAFMFDICMEYLLNANSDYI